MRAMRRRCLQWTASTQATRCSPGARLARVELAGAACVCGWPGGGGGGCGCGARAEAKEVSHEALYARHSALCLGVRVTTPTIIVAVSITSIGTSIGASITATAAAIASKLSCPLICIQPGILPTWAIIIVATIVVAAV